MGNNAEAIRQEIEQLIVPVVGREGPAMVEHDRLGALRPPVLEVDLGAVCGPHIATAHHIVLLTGGGRNRLPHRRDRSMNAGAVIASPASPPSNAAGIWAAWRPGHATAGLLTRL